MHHAKCPHVRSLTAHKVTEDTREVVILCLLSCNVTGGSSNLCCLKIDKPALRKSDHEADAVIYERCLTGAIACAWVSDCTRATQFVWCRYSLLSVMICILKVMWGISGYDAEQQGFRTAVLMCEFVHGAVSRESSSSHIPSFSPSSSPSCSFLSPVISGPALNVLQWLIQCKLTVSSDFSLVFSFLRTPCWLLFYL